VVSPTLTTSGEQRCYNTKTSECRSCEVLWVVDLRILRDPSHRLIMGMCVSRREHVGVHVSSNGDAMCGGFVAEKRDVDDLRHVPRILPMGFGLTGVPLGVA
jgi:hypothetical protein